MKGVLWRLAVVALVAKAVHSFVSRPKPTTEKPVLSEEARRFFESTLDWDPRLTESLDIVKRFIKQYPYKSPFRKVE